jgi:hypothetical protein
VPEGRKRDATGRTVCDGLGFEEICLVRALVSQTGNDPQGVWGRSWGQRNAWMLTYHIARPPLSSEKRWVALEGVAKVDQERSTTLEADHWVVRAYLHGQCCLLHGYLLEPLCFRYHERSVAFIYMQYEPLKQKKKRSYDQHTVNTVRLTNVTREEPLLEHVETGHA